ncbi:MAG: hypothetical protein LZF63_06020, partial [Nitrosomonas sp.]|nr:hypothetical protein [Nitrosomonas sp.]
ISRDYSFLPTPGIFRNCAIECAGAASIGCCIRPNDGFQTNLRRMLIFVPSLSRRNIQPYGV